MIGMAATLGKHHGSHEATRLAHEVALLFFVGPEFARVGNGVADVAQGLQQPLGTRNGRIVLDEGLLMREANRDLVDPRHAAEGLLDRSRAERTMQPPMRARILRRSGRLDGSSLQGSNMDGFVAAMLIFASTQLFRPTTRKPGS
jgi:hypothetical protein